VGVFDASTSPPKMLWGGGEGAVGNHRR